MGKYTDRDGPLQIIGLGPIVSCLSLILLSSLLPIVMAGPGDPLVWSFYGSYDNRSDGWETIRNAGDKLEWVHDMSQNAYVRTKDLDVEEYGSFLAPEKFLGKKVSAYKGSLRWKLRYRDCECCDEPSFHREFRDDVIIHGAGLRLEFDIRDPFPVYEHNVPMKHYRLDFDESESYTGTWNVKGTDRVPTRHEMLEVLHDLTRLEIRWDFTACTKLVDFDEVQMVEGLAPPRPRSLSPSDGPSSGGTLVTITGQDVVNTHEEMFCRYVLGNTTNETDAEFVDESTITCKSPAFPQIMDDNVQVDLYACLDMYSCSEWAVPFHMFVPPTTYSVQPHLGPDEGNTSVTVIGTNFLDGENLKCKFGDEVVPAVYRSRTSMLCSTPFNPGKDEVLVTVSLNGADFSLGNATFTYYPTPIITSISPDYGDASGGYDLTIYGQNFFDSEYAHCRTSAGVWDATYVSETQIICAVEEVEDATEVKIQLTLSPQDLTATFGTLHVYELTKFEPQHGPRVGGFDVFLTGRGFSNETEGLTYCLFGDVKVKGRYVDEGTIACQAPGKEDATTVSVTLNDRDYSTVDAQLFYYSVQEFFPPIGPAVGGAEVEVYGLNFVAGTALESIKCKFGDAVVPAIGFPGEDSVLCSSPQLADHDAHAVALDLSFNNGSDFTADGRVFSYFGMEGMTPRIGPSAGGSKVKVSGFGFAMAVEGGIHCRFGDVEVAGQVHNSNVECDAPPASGSVGVEISLNGRDYTNSSLTFSYFSVADVSPHSGSEDGGTPLIVEGEGMGAFSALLGIGEASEDDLHCRFNGTKIVQGVFDHDNTTVSCVSPPGDGTDSLEVSFDGTFYATSPQPYVYYGVNSFTPTYGPIDGHTEVTITVRNIETADQDLPLQCLFGKSMVVPARHIHHDDGALYLGCTTPPANVTTDSGTAGHVPLEVSLNGVDFSSDDVYFHFYLAKSVSPSYAPSCGNSSVVISGEEIASTSPDMMKCRFGSQIVPASVTGDGEITCLSPSLDGTGIAPVDFTLNGVDFTSANISFSYYDVVDYQPRRAPEVGHSLVRVYVGVREFTGSQSDVMCAFGEAVVKGYFNYTSSEVQCFTPPGNGTVPLQVSLNGRDFTQADTQFEYYGVEELSTHYGPESGGSKVMLSGRNLNDVGDTVLCRFGESLAVDVHFDEHQNRYICISPEGAGTVTVEISLNGRDYTSSGHQFHYYRVDRVLPVVGPASGNTSVVVHGRGLANSGADHMSCRFGTVEVLATFHEGADGDHYLQCNSPSFELCKSRCDFTQEGTSGVVPVEITLNGRDYTTNHLNFSYVDVAGFSPYLGPNAGGTEVTVFGVGFQSLDSQMLEPSCMFGDDIVKAAFNATGQFVTCTSPPGEGTVALEVSMNGQDYTTSEHLFFYYNVSTISPNTSPVGGGVTVEVTGTNLQEVGYENMRCKFGSEEAPMSFKPVKKVVGGKLVEVGGTYTCVSPPNTGIQPLEITMNGRDYTHDQLAFYYYNLKQVSPSRGPESGNSTVQFVGVNFTPQDAEQVNCKFDDVVVAGLVDVATSGVVCQSPPNPSKRGVAVPVEVTLNKDLFTQTNTTFGYYSVTRITPHRGPTDGGSSVTVHGRGFVAPDEPELVKCRFGDAVVDGSVVSASDGEDPGDAVVVCESPKGRDVVALEVSLNGRDFSTDDVEFTYFGIHSLEPDCGPVGGATVVELVGSHIDYDVISEARCAIGDVIVNATLDQDKQVLQCVTPTSLEGTVDVFVTLNGRDYTQTPIEFHFFDVDVSDERSGPFIGPSSGNSTVVIYGSEFSDTGSIACRFGDTVVEGSFNPNTTAIECVTPVLTAGGHAFEVTLNNRDWTASGITFYTFTTTTLTPVDGPTDGDSTVRIHLEGAFPDHVDGDDVMCAFGDKLVRGTFNSTSQVVTCDSPHGKGTVKLEVSLNGRDLTKGGLEFAYYGIHGITPEFGPFNASSVVEILGDNVDYSEATDPNCKFGDVVVSASFNEESQTLECVTPTTLEGTVEVEITLNGRDYTQTPIKFHFFSLTVSDERSGPFIGPSSGNSTVVIYGSEFSDTGSIACRFGDTVVEGSFNPNTTAIECVTPAASAAGSTSLEVTLNGRDWTVSGQTYTYYSIHSIRPPCGPVGGDTVAVLDGTGLIGDEVVDQDDIVCLVGGVPAHATMVGAATVECKMPAWSAAESVPIQLTMNGRDFTTDAVEYTYYSLSSISPVRGPSTGMSSVTLNVTNACPDTSGSFCLFDKDKVNATVDKEGIWSCKAPPGVGTAQVSVGFGGGDPTATQAEFHFFSVDVNRTAPMYGPVDGNTTVIVRGEEISKDADVAPKCRFGGVTVDGRVVSERSDDVVMCESPPAHGLVSFEMSLNGRDFTSSGLQFQYYDEHDVDPDIGPSSGRTTVTISGAGLLPRAAHPVVVRCRFGDKIVPGDWVVNTTSVTCVAPPGEGTQSVDVSLNGVDYTSTGISYFYHRVTELSTRFAPASGGSELRVGGPNTDKAKQGRCKFGSKVVDGLGVQGGELVCKVPPMDTMDMMAGDESLHTSIVPVEISLNGQDFSTDANYMTYFALRDLSPELGPSVGGNAVALSGLNLQFTNNTKCRFGNAVVDGAWNMEQQAVVCPSPAGSANVQVDLSLNGEDFTQARLAYSYYRMTSMDVDSGPDQGGATVVVSGDNFESFNGSDADVLCRFGSTVGRGAFNTSSHQVNCVSPPGRGDMPLDISLNGRDFTSFTETNYTYYRVRQPDPMHGPSSGNTKLHFTVDSGNGRNLYPDAVCRFGDNTVPVVSNGTKGGYYCLSPPGLDNARFEVAMNGRDFTNTSLLFGYFGLLSVYPPLGPSSGKTTVLVRGSNLISSTPERRACRFGDIVVPIYPGPDDNTVRCSSPASIGNTDVSLEVTLTGADYTTDGLTFHYYNVDSMHPVLGPSVGNTTVDISGKGLADAMEIARDEDIICQFGKDVMKGTRGDNNQSVICTSPANKNVKQAPKVPLDVTLNGKDFLNQGWNFTFYAVDGASTYVGPAVGGAEVCLYGTNLDSVAVGPETMCRFGSQTVRASRPSTSEAVEDVVPGTVHAQEGDDDVVTSHVCCSTPPASPKSGEEAAVSLELTLNGRDYTSSGLTYHYYQLGAVSPAWGPAKGGTVVVVTGVGFDQQGSYILPQCRFGKVVVNATLDAASETVSCSSPPADAVSSSLTEFIFDTSLEVTLNGRDFSDSGLRYRYYTLTTAAPISGPASGGSSVVLSGHLLPLANASKPICRFGQLKHEGDYLEEGGVECLAPKLAPDQPVEVDVALNQRDFTESGIIYYPYDVLTMVPDRGPKEGGSLLQLNVSSASLIPTEELVVKCRFGDVELEGFRDSDTKLINCYVPAPPSDALQVPVDVSLNGRDFTRSANTFRFYAVTKIHKHTGPAVGGSNVVVDGIGFADTEELLKCKFGEKEVPGSFKADKYQVECLSPPGTGLVTVSVTFNGRDYTSGDARACSFDYFEMYSFSPMYGPVEGGATVTITGRGFEEAPKEDIHCKFGEQVAKGFYIGRNDTVLCLAPPVASPGSVNISLTLNGEDYTRPGRQFKYFEAGNIHPALGPARGFTPVKVLGIAAHHLRKNDVMCAFGDVVVPATVDEELEEALCQSPPMDSEASVPVEVSLDGGQTFSQKKHMFHYYTITDVGPLCGPAEGGTHVTIRGTNFEDTGLDHTMCRFTSEIVPAHYQDGAIVCDAPKGHVPSAVQVSLIGSAGFTVDGPDFVYYTLESVVPKHAPEAGGSHIVLNGKGFGECGLNPESEVKCQIHGVTVDGTFNPHTKRVDCIAPPGEGQGQINVTFNGNDWSNSKSFSYYGVGDIVPDTGPAGGGTVVTILGEGFSSESEDEIICKFADVEVLGSMVDSTHITCTSPPGLEGSVSVEFTNNGNDFTNTGLSFNYYSASTLEPALGPTRGSTDVYVGGMNIQDAGDGSIKCRFGTSEVAGEYFAERGVIKCKAPPAAKPEPVSVDITLNGKDYTSNALTYRYYEVGAAYPVAAPTHGATKVKLKVSGVKPSEVVDGDMICQFGDVEVAATVVSDEDGLIQCAAPEGHGQVDLDVTLNGRDYTEKEQTFFYYAVTDVSPQFVPASGGAQVTVTGEHFIPPRADESPKCRFGDEVVEGKYVSSSKSMLCTSPPGSGEVAVEVALNGRDFTSNNKKVSNFGVVSLSPSYGPIAGGTSLTVRGPFFPPDSHPSCRIGNSDVPGEVVMDQLHRVVRCEVPEMTTAGGVTVDLSFGHGFTDDGVKFHVYELQSFSPKVGPSQGGHTVTIKGRGIKGFSGPTDDIKCKFGNRVARAWVSTKADDAVECESPGGDGHTSLGFSLNGEDFAYNTDVKFSFYSVSSVSPSSGPCVGRSEVMVMGKGFQDFGFSPQCRFGSSVVNGELVTDKGETYVKCTSPSGTGGVEVDVSLNGEDFTSSGVSFFYYCPDRISPTRGPTQGGTMVTLLGDNLVKVPHGDAKCAFGHVKVEASFLDDMLGYRCKVPKRAGRDAVNVALTLNNRDYTVGELEFLYYDLRQVTPSRVASSGGTVVTFSGIGFGEYKDREDEIQCLFGKDKVVGNFHAEDGTVRCRAPSSSGLLDADITLNGHDFTQVALPMLFTGVDHVNPVAGFGAGGTEVVLYGPCLDAYDTSKDLQCLFGQQEAPAKFDDGRHQLVCLSPPGVGETTLEIGWDGGRTYNGNSFRFYAPGETFLYNHFDSSSEGWQASHNSDPLVDWDPDTHAIKIRDKSNDYGWAVAPAKYHGDLTLAYGGKIRYKVAYTRCVGCNNDWKSFPDDLIIQGGGLTLVYDFPAVGGVDGDTPRPEVPVISSHGIMSGIYTQVEVDVADATKGWTVKETQVVPSEDDMLRVLADVTDVTFRWDFREGKAKTVEIDDFEVTAGVAPVRIFDFTPKKGPSTGGTLVTIHGSGITESPAAMCRFGDVSVKATLIEANTVTCVTPIGEGSALISYSNDNSRFFTNHGDFTYYSTRLTSIEPTSGPSTGGITITFHGTDVFDAQQDLQIKFGETIVYATFVDAVTLATELPPGAGDVMVYFTMNGVDFQMTGVTFSFYSYRVPIVKVQDIPAKVNVDDTIELVGEADSVIDMDLTYHWTVVSGILDLNDHNIVETDSRSPTLRFKPGSLPQGVTWEFTLTATDILDGVSSVVKLTTNVNPEGGKLTVIPTVGEEFLTPFALKASGWRDEDELSYQLFIVMDSHGKQYYLPLNHNSFHFLPKTPTSDLPVVLVVTDSYGGSATVASKVTITHSEPVDNPKQFADNMVAFVFESLKLDTHAPEAHGEVARAILLEAAARLNEIESSLTSEEKRKFRSNMLEALVGTVAAGHDGDVLEDTRVARDLLAFPADLSGEDLKRGLEFVKALADSLLDVDLESAENIVASMSSLLYAVANNEEEGLTDADAQQVAADIIHSVEKVVKALLHGTVLGDPPIPIEAGDLSLLAARETPENLALLPNGDEIGLSVDFPQSLLDNMDLSGWNSTILDLEIIQWRTNPYAYSSFSDGLLSNVTTIKLYKEDGDKLDVSGLTEPISIEMAVSGGRVERSNSTGNWTYSCRYWKELYGWVDDGCVAVEKQVGAGEEDSSVGDTSAVGSSNTQTTVICQCDHLTDFSVKEVFVERHEVIDPSHMHDGPEEVTPTWVYGLLGVIGLGCVLGAIGGRRVYMKRQKQFLAMGDVFNGDKTAANSALLREKMEDNLETGSGTSFATSVSLFGRPGSKKPRVAGSTASTTTSTPRIWVQTPPPKALEDRVTESSHQRHRSSKSPSKERGIAWEADGTGGATAGRSKSAHSSRHRSPLSAGRDRGRQGMEDENMRLASSILSSAAGGDSPARGGRSPTDVRERSAMKKSTRSSRASPLRVSPAPRSRATSPGGSGQQVGLSPAEGLLRPSPRTTATPLRGRPSPHTPHSNSHNSMVGGGDSAPPGASAGASSPHSPHHTDKPGQGPLGRRHSKLDVLEDPSPAPLSASSRVKPRIGVSSRTPPSKDEDRKMLDALLGPSPSRKPRDPVTAEADLAVQDFFLLKDTRPQQ